MASINSISQYKTVILENRGHVTDVRFLEVLNREGLDGWKLRESQELGASRLAILMERDITLDSPRNIGEDSEVGKVEDDCTKA